MTINEAISTLDNLKPNTATRSDKIKWLARLDGEIKTEIVDAHYPKKDCEPDKTDRRYTDETSGDTELIAGYPYDELYVLYLSAMIDYNNGEVSRYNNSMAMFNAKYKDFSDWYNRNYMPKGIKDMRYF